MPQQSHTCVWLVNGNQDVVAAFTDVKVVKLKAWMVTNSRNIKAAPVVGAVAGISSQQKKEEDLLSESKSQCM